MKLKELLAIIDSGINLKVEGEIKRFRSKIEIAEELKNYEVVTINADSGELVVTLGVVREVPSLEELGYSFDSGM